MNYLREQMIGWGINYIYTTPVLPKEKIHLMSHFLSLDNDDE